MNLKTCYQTPNRTLFVLLGAHDIKRYAQLTDHVRLS